MLYSVLLEHLALFLAFFLFFFVFCKTFVPSIQPTVGGPRFANSCVRAGTTAVPPLAPQGPLAVRAPAASRPAAADSAGFGAPGIGAAGPPTPCLAPQGPQTTVWGPASAVRASVTRECWSSPGCVRWRKRVASSLLSSVLLEDPAFFHNFLFFAIPLSQAYDQQLAVHYLQTHDLAPRWCPGRSSRRKGRISGPGYQRPRRQRRE